MKQATVQATQVATCSNVLSDLKNGVNVVCPTTNNAIVKIGTTGTDPATWFPLSPGQTLFVPGNSSLVVSYLTDSTTAQTLHLIGS